MLIDSGLVFSILQPAPFMQNILNAKEALVHSNVFVQKFFTGMDSTNLLNMIDVEDFGKCAAEIVLVSRYEYATLELCGPQNLSVAAILADMENVTGQTVKLEYISDHDIREMMTKRNASEYSIETLLKMFQHYNGGDFCGSGFTTSIILQRTPPTFIEFLKRELK